jgi:hypothetical protein
MPFLLLVGDSLWRLGPIGDLLSLVSEFFNRSFQMLTVIGEFSFCTFVTEEFDFAVGEFGSDCVLECVGFAGTEIFGFGDETDGDAFDAFGVAEVG